MIILLMMLMKISTSFAFEVKEIWNQENRLQIEFQCSSIDRFCHDLCLKDDSCKVEEKVCLNCVGTSMLMNSIFEQMGLKYRNTQEEVSSYELIDFLNKNNFVSITSKSIFNQIEAYDSPVLKSRFQSLCPENIAYPLVIFELNPTSHTPRSVKYVLCDEKIFRMTDSPIILTGEIRYAFLK
jgi:hypothetical protein